MYHSMLRALLTVLFALPFAVTSVSAQVPERVTFLHHDAFGSLVAATDAQGQIVWAGSPEPFGAVDDPNAAPRFVDQPRAAAGLFQLSARVYDPFTGRFLSPDPQSLAEVDLTNPQRLNRYTYGLNNPYRYQDATGEVPVETVLDIIDIGMSAYDLYNEPSWLNAGMVAWSVAAVVVPYMPGAWVAKAGKAGAAAADAAAGAGKAAGGGIAARAEELRGAIPAAQQGRITIGVGLAEDASGAQRVLIGTSEPRGYLRPGVTLAPGETLAPGLGHAEADIVNFAQQNGLRLLEVGASRPICPGCAALIEGAGARPVTPLKVP